jgi:hypothetical protein
VLAGPERVAELAEVDELRTCDSRTMSCAPRLISLSRRETERQRVARIVGPLDDVDELAANEIGQAHGDSSV